MPLNTRQKNMVVKVDSQVRNILARDGDSEIIAQLSSLNPHIKSIINSANQSEIEKILKQYPGFAYYLNLLDGHFS
jgi:hypothetical protein